MVRQRRKKEGRASGDRGHEGRQKQQDTRDCRPVSQALGLCPDPRQHRRLHHGGRLRRPGSGVKQLLADKAYDTNAFRAYLKKRKIRIVIPGKSNRKKRLRLDRTAYKKRNVIERCFGRLKDFRRIATRYDKLAEIYLSPLCLVATVATGFDLFESRP